MPANAARPLIRFCEPLCLNMSATREWRLRDCQKIHAFARFDVARKPTPTRERVAFCLILGGLSLARRVGVAMLGDVIFT